MSKESNKESSFRITKVEGEGESLTKTRRAMIDNLKGITPGKTVLGAIGRDLSVEEPEIPKEELTPEEKQIKKELKEFLIKYIPIPDFGSKFKPEQVKVILRKKLDKMTLGELRRFWAGKIPSDENITEDDIEELSRKWNDISP